jgi:fibronectin type 3 domain-containing protein
VLSPATAASGVVSLSWTVPANGGSAILGYVLYRGTSSGGKSAIANLGTGTSYNDMTVTNGTTYYYAVAARNAVGEGAQSNERSATPAAPADTTAPSKPGGMDVLVAGSSQLVIDWNPSTDNVGVTAYDVYRGGVLVGTVTTTYFLESGLAASTTYTYTVRARDAAGNRSAASNNLSARTASSSTVAKGSLAGFVHDASGTGVRTAVATFTPSSGATKTDGANNKGVWSISNLNAGSGTLTISAPGYATVTLSVSVVGGKTVLAPDTTLG